MKTYIFQEYRDVTYYDIMPNRYIISERGHVCDRVTGRTMTPYQNRNGYWYVRLWNTDGTKFNHVAVHRAVAWEVVLTDRDPNLDINHKDGNKSNNHWSNLEWVTRKQNILHSVAHGLAGKGDHKGILNGQAKVNEEQVHQICTLLQDTNLSYPEIIDKLNLPVSVNVITKIKQGHTWTHISGNYDFSHR